MSRFQAMVLAINTSILAVIFVFSSWLYLSTKAEVLLQVDSSLARAVAMTDALATLKSRELGTLAQSMAVSPMLRGAAATGDAATIRDVLDTLARKNGVAAVELRSAGKLRYGSGKEGRGFSGSAPAGEQQLWVWQAPDRPLLDSWSGVTGARYALAEGGVHNLPAEDAGLSSRKVSPSKVEALEGESGLYYARAADFGGGKLQGVVFAERSPFWRSFESRRNSLIVLGAVLFFAGLLLSAVFARLFAGAAQDGTPASSAEFQGLLDEIESARAGRLRPDGK